jgi:hypothetical protein
MNPLSKSPIHAGCRFWPAAILFLCLLRSAEASPFRHPRITSSRLDQAPTVDGVVDKAEWLTAARGMPLIERNSAVLTDASTSYWVGHTDEALYLAFRSLRPLYAITPSPEDRVEFFLQPEAGRPDFWFEIRSDGSMREGLRHHTTDHGWSAPWSSVVRHTDTGWEGELRIPFRSLGLDAAPPAGTAWRLLVMENRVTPHGVLSVSSFLGGGGAWPAKENMGVLLFGDEAAPAVRLLESGPLTTAEGGVLLEVTGGSRPARIEAEAALYRQVSVATVQEDSGEGGDIWIPVTAEMNFFQLLDSASLEEALEHYEQVATFSESFELNPRHVRRFPWSADISPGKYVLIYTVRGEDGGEPLASGVLPFTQRPAFSVEIVPFLVSAQAVSIRSDYQRMQQVPEGSLIQAEMLDDKTGEVLASIGTAADPQRRRTVLNLPAGELFDREVRIRTALTDKGGQVLAESIQPMRLPPRPEWLGWDGGPGPDEVLPPWTPIQLEGDTADIVLRRIRFGANSFPEAIRSRDRELLTAPMRLTLAESEPQWTRALVEAGPARVRWQSTARRNGLVLTVDALLEYDGMLRYDITLDPGGQAADLRDLVLHIPYAASASLQTEDRDIREFQHSMELFDMDTGLQWFAEWAKGWQIGEAPVFELRNNGDTLDWRIRMIGQEGKTITEPLTLTFGMIPTPVRELDLSVSRTFRHTHPFGGSGWSAEQATMTLSYPVSGLLDSEQGAILFRANFFGNATRLFQIGSGADSLNLYYIRARFNRWGRSLWLTQGEAEIDSNGASGRFERRGALNDLITPTTGWQDLALTWTRTGTDRIRLELSALEPPEGRARSMVFDMPYAEWRRILAADRFRFGGGDALAMDWVATSRTALTSGMLSDRFTALSNGETEGFSLVDPLERLRLHQGKYLSLPSVSETGSGGIAGGPFSGLFVEPVDTATGRGLLLPAGERSGAEVMRAYGMTMYMPIHEQFHHHAGFYHSEHIASPVLRHRFRTIQEEDGLGIMMYGGFGFESRDHRLAGVREELIRRPERPVFSGAVHCLATPAKDYFSWHWQQNIDYFQPLGGMFDNTVHIWECTSPEHGCGWHDDSGELRGRRPIFDARELSKRLRWIWHVYRVDQLGAPGLYSLHAGARNFWAVSGFADSIKFGEGWMMGTEFTLLEPETGWRDGWQWRTGIVGELLPKQEFMFSQNWVMLYGLLYNQPFRLYGTFLDPVWWHVNTQDPARTRRNPGEFNPYFAEKGVPNFAAPHALWWQVQDDFDTWTAEFHPFWRNQDMLRLNHSALRASLHLHPGQAVMFVVSNFHEDAVEVVLTPMLERLGLEDGMVDVWDAFTGEEYPFNGSEIRFSLPSYQYRLIRMERRRP